MNISIPIYMDYSATTPVDERVGLAHHECQIVVTGQFAFRGLRAASGKLHDHFTGPVIEFRGQHRRPWRRSPPSGR